MSRESAWKFANKFVSTPENQKRKLELARDNIISEIARLVSNSQVFLMLFSNLSACLQGDVAQKTFNLKSIEKKKPEYVVV